MKYKGSRRKHSKIKKQLYGGEGFLNMTRNPEAINERLLTWTV